MSAPPAPRPNIDPVPRVILGFVQDEDGTWIAELDCAHRRHVVHRPPLSDHPWVRTREGRAGRVGQRIECGRCAQRIWPDTVERYASSRTFSDTTVPANLLEEHTTRPGVWGQLEVLAGELLLDFRMSLGVSDELAPGTLGIIPPEVVHRVELRGPVRFVVHFHRRPQV